MRGRDESVCEVANLACFAQSALALMGEAWFDVRADPATLCRMKPPIYLTDPKEIRKARSTQPRATLPRLLRQEGALRSAAEKFSADAKNAISSRGRVKTAA